MTKLTPPHTIVDRKTRIGDWEADTIVGKNQKSALLTLVERTTRYTIICKLKNLRPLQK